MRHISSKLIHGNESIESKDKYNSLKTPIYQSASFDFNTSNEMEVAFRGESDAYTYSRISNPTVNALQDSIKVLSNADDVICVSSGMAAISNVFFTICQKGENIITSNYLFGNTYSFFESTLSSFGVETKFLDLNSIEEIEKSIDKNTRAIFLEIPTNPQLIIYDIEAISNLAEKNNLLLIVDNSVLTPYLFESKKYKIDIEVFSNTKFISGGATSIGGTILTYESEKWSKVPKLENEYNQFGSKAFIKKLYGEIYRNIGACLSPSNAWLQLLGLETLTLRIDKVNENALKVAQFLLNNKHVKSVEYSSLDESYQNNLSRKYFPKGAGALINLNLGTKEKCFKFMDSLKMIRRGTNFCDNKSMVIHPYSTIYWSLDDETKQKMLIDEGLIRLSIGIEHISDLTENLHQALEKV